LIGNDDSETVVGGEVPVDIVVEGPLVVLEGHSFDVLCVLVVVFDGEVGHGYDISDVINEFN